MDIAGRHPRLMGDGDRLGGGGKSGLDAYNRAHLEETKARIEAALEAGLERSL